MIVVVVAAAEVVVAAAAAATTTAAAATRTNYDIARCCFSPIELIGGQEWSKSFPQCTFRHGTGGAAVVATIAFARREHMQCGFSAA